MNEQTSLPYVCAKHDQPLANVLNGGAGWCASCHTFVQSANHPMPTLPPELIAKREAGRIAARKEKTKAARQRNQRSAA